MATLSPDFRAQSGKIHREHELMIEDLAGLDSALDRLICYSEVYANLASAEQVRTYGCRLAERFPEHCRCEEAAVLSPVSQVSQELARFAQQMRDEHRQLLARLDSFCQALHRLEQCEDLDETICRLKEEGKELARELRRHVATEERELSGFL